MKRRLKWLLENYKHGWRYVAWHIWNMRPGLELSIICSFKCSQQCEYCGCKMPKGVMPKDPPTRKTTNAWMEYIRVFKPNVRSVMISGGEPTIDVTAMMLAERLLTETTINVWIFTNLHNYEALLCLPPTWRLIIYATYHKGVRGTPPAQEWRRRFEMVRKRHKSSVPVELETNTLHLDGEEVRPLLTEDDVFGPGVAFSLGPDARIFRSCGERTAAYQEDAK